MIETIEVSGIFLLGIVLGMLISSYESMRYNDREFDKWSKQAMRLSNENARLRHAVELADLALALDDIPVEGEDE